MRRYENACMGCGATGGTCLHCEAKIIECDMCGCEIDGTAYSFPIDESDEDYCCECIKNRVSDLAVVTDDDVCPYCESEGGECFFIDFGEGEQSYYFCNECIDIFSY